MRRILLWLCGMLLLTLPAFAQVDAWQAAMDAGQAAMNAGKRDEAITAYTKAVALSAEFAADDDRANDCHVALAQAYNRASRPDDANQVISRLLARRLRALGLADPKLATTYLALGDYYLATGNYDAAKPQYDRALAICTKAYGDGDPRLAPYYTGLGDYYSRKNDSREAVAALQTAIALIEKGGGKESPELAKPLTRLARLYQNLRLYTEAEAAYARAQAVVEKAFGPDDMKLVETLQAVGAYYWYQGRKPEQALPNFLRVLAIQEKTLKPDDPQVLGTVQSLAALSNTLCRYDDAAQYYRRLIAAYGAATPGARSALYARVGLATALIRGKRMVEAREETERLMTLSAKMTDSDSYYMRQDFYRQIAQAYHQAGAYVETDAAYRAWLEFVEKVSEPSRGGVRMDPLNNVLTLWAGFYRQYGKEAEAEKLLRRLADVYKTRGGIPTATRVALAECLLSQGKDTELDAPAPNPEQRNNQPDLLMTAWALLQMYRGLDLLDAAAPLPRLGRSLAMVELELVPHKAVANVNEQFATAEPLLKGLKESWDAVPRPEYDYNKQTINYQNALAMSNYAALLIITGKFTEAKPLLAKARKLTEAAQPTFANTRLYARSTPAAMVGELAPVLINQAALRFRELQAERGTPKEVLADVVAPLEAALAEREELYGAWSPQYGRVLINLGTAYAVAGEAEKAKKVLSEAKTLFEGMLGKDDPAVATIAARLNKLQ